MNNFTFVTGNIDKVKLLEKFLGQKVEHHSLDLHEIQSLDPHKVAKEKALEAYKILKKPVLVDDVSLGVKSLGGLPGPFVKFFLESIGGEGICRLADLSDDRSATAVLVFGLYDGKKFYNFDAETKGSISQHPRGDTTKLTMMGWNPIFIPAGQAKTVAEMTEDELEKFTPRGQAVKKLKAFLNGRIDI